MIFECLTEFQRDLKQLLKRFRSIEEDLETLKKYLITCPSAFPPTSFLLNNLNSNQEIIKIKKFACKALKGKGSNSGIRIIYAFHKDEQKIVFIELYFKGDKASEDRDRIIKYYGKK
ncbi:MAG: hypothetical protein QME05_02275 [Candidatus Margulisbacteria bacterium]|nr:hypothetical protein [Candidatus Margulisiibacteriota bacterium]